MSLPRDVSVGHSSQPSFVQADHKPQIMLHCLSHTNFPLVHLRSCAFMSHPRSRTFATLAGASQLGTPCHRWGGSRLGAPCLRSSAPRLSTLLMSALQFVPIIPPNSSRVRSSCACLTGFFPLNSSRARSLCQPNHSTELNSP
jgi:hypothetical protein